jgi:hypothetical protein
LCIEKIEGNEDLNDDLIIIKLKRWFPEKWKFSDSDLDYLLNTKLIKSTDDLKSLSLLVNIPFENILFTKPPSMFEYWKVQECAEVALLEWNVSSNNVLSKPFSLME